MKIKGGLKFKGAAKAKQYGDPTDFEIWPGLDSGVHRLIETPLSINGAVGSTILRFNGPDASAAGFPEYGGAGTLDLGAGAAPSYDQPSPYLGSLDGAVVFSAAGFVSAGNLITVGTQDLAVEAVVKMVLTSVPSNGIIIGTRGSSGNGMLLFKNGSSLYFYLEQSGATSQVTIGTPTLGAICHVLVIIRRAGNQIGYLNAVAGTAVSVSSVGSLAAAQLSVGVNTVNTEVFASDVLFAAIHARAGGWIDTEVQTVLAAQRFALLTGSRPAFSVVPSTYPSSQGSTSVAYQPIVTSGVTRLHYMSAGAPRFERRVDANGRTLVGAVVELGGQNDCLQSDALGTTWTGVALTSISANGQAASDGQTTLDGLVGTAASTAHGVTQTITMTAAPWCISAEVKAGDKSWCYLVDETIAAGGAYYDIANNAWGTVGAGVVDKGVLYTAAGTVRAIWIRVLGTAAAHTVGIYAASGDGGQTFAGDAATVNLWAGKVNVEAADYPSSRINTTTGAVTRAAGVLKYDITNLLGSAAFTIVCRVLLPSFTPSVVRTLFSLNDGTTNNRVDCTVDTSGRLNGVGRKASGTDGDVQIAGSICDNAIRTVMLSGREGLLEIRSHADSGGWTSIVQDTSFTPPTGLTTLCIGHDASSALQAGPAIIGDVVIYDHYIPTYRWALNARPEPRLSVVLGR